MARIDNILKIIRDADGTDLHLVAGTPPVLRRVGELERTSHPELTEKQVKNLIYEIIPDDLIRRFERDGDLDFAYGDPDQGRFRINVFKSSSGVGAAIRVIPDRVMTLDQLGLQAEVTKLLSSKSGLILVTGPTNSGKTTTQAAMIDHINRRFSKHIITLEDPIEYVHRSERSLVTQRQIGAHTESFARALKSALREDPDVILVGEMRDTESISLALTAAEVGLLVFGTLHTNSAAQTVDRILDVFPSDQQPQVRVMLAETLQGVISQQLLRRADGVGRILAAEVMLRTSSIAALIRDGKTHQIPGVIQTHRKLGMNLLDDRLRVMVDKGLITPSEAARVAQEPMKFMTEEKPIPNPVSSL